MFHPRGPTVRELVRQALSSTRAGYDLLAPKFDFTPFRTPDWLLDAVAPRLGERRSVARAIDLCCGTGAALRILRPLCRELVVGVDFSLGMLAQARCRGATPAGDADGSALDTGSPRLVLAQQDVLDLGFRESFDVATIFGALGHLRPRVQRQFLTSARSCLAPGGRLILLTAPTPPPWSPALWISGAFDAALWLRNRLHRPPFVMYYLAWPLGRARRLLRDTGFDVGVERLALPRGAGRLRLIVARRG